ncbi:MAG: hypothetical protein ABSB65_07730 [Candidatus Acidiferrales bacterium]|jgi:hypothetical protein
MLHIFLIWFAAVLVLATAALAWIMVCGAIAQWAEKEGLAFWKTFALSFFLTPLAGALMVLSFKPPRTTRSLAETASRG